MKLKYAIFAGTLFATVIIDQLLKSYIRSMMALHDSITVIPGFFNITYGTNPGAAFGFLAKAPPAFRTLFLILVSIVAIVLILYFIVKNKATDNLLTLSLSFIMGGAIGNLVDRVRAGEVTDFLDFSLASYHWPAFNMADSFISIGAVILIYEIFKRRG